MSQALLPDLMKDRSKGEETTLSFSYLSYLPAFVSIITLTIVGILYTQSNDQTRHVPYISTYANGGAQQTVLTYGLGVFSALALMIVLVVTDYVWKSLLFHLEKRQKYGLLRVKDDQTKDVDRADFYDEKNLGNKIEIIFSAIIGLIGAFSVAISAIFSEGTVSLLHLISAGGSMVLGGIWTFYTPYFFPSDLYEIYGVWWYAPGILGLLLSGLLGSLIILTSSSSVAQTYVSPIVEYSIYATYNIYPLMLSSLMKKVRFGVIREDQMNNHPLHLGYLSIATIIIILVTSLSSIAVYLSTKSEDEPTVPYIGTMNFNPTTRYIMSLGLGFMSACIFMSVIGLGAFVWSISKTSCARTWTIILSFIGAISSTTSLLSGILPNDHSNSHFIIAAVTFACGSIYMMLIPSLFVRKHASLYGILWYVPGTLAVLCTGLIGLGYLFDHEQWIYRVYVMPILQWVILGLWCIFEGMIAPILSRVAFISDVSSPIED